MICKHADKVYENDWCPVANTYCTAGKECDFVHNHQTNADSIRAMSDEELAEWLVKQTVYQESAWSEPSYLNFLTNRDDTKERAIKGTVEWLKQPAEVEHD